MISVIAIRTVAHLSPHAQSCPVVKKPSGKVQGLSAALSMDGPGIQSQPALLGFNYFTADLLRDFITLGCCCNLAIQKGKDNDRSCLA